MKRIAINGFGRIGRLFLRHTINLKEINVVCINDLMSIEEAVYLFTHDSVYGALPFDVTYDEEKSTITVDGKTIKYFSIRTPQDLPWSSEDIDVVVEATGKFADYKKANAHRMAGAKHIVVSAPVKGDPPKEVTGATVLVGVNEGIAKLCDVTSNGSCTTNAIGIAIKAMNDSFGVNQAILNTVHASTAGQAVVDSSGRKNLRLSRATSLNIIPTTTGAAIATTKAIPELAGKFDGIALRIPLAVGSIADITFTTEKKVTVDEVNKVLTDIANSDPYKLFAVTDEEIVSSDIVGQPYSAIADLSLTRVVDGSLTKILLWYDNEVGYVHTLIRHVMSI